MASYNWPTEGSTATGTVTSVGLSVPATSIFSVTGSPVTTSGTLGLVTTGTSGGVLYFSSTSAVSSSAALGSGRVVLGGGAGSAPVTNANLSFNTGTNTLTTVNGSFSGNIGVVDATLSGNLVAVNGTFSGVVTLSALTLSTALVLNASKQIVSSATTATEIGYVSGVTSAIQTQLNGKQASGNYITALTGDGSASGPGSAALTLATVNSNVGSFGSATQVGGFTVNAKGLVTAASNTSIQIAQSQVTNLVSDLAAKQATGNYITALTSDVTASGPGSVAATIAANVVTNAKLAQMAATTIKGNNTGGTANAADLTVAQVAALFTKQTQQIFTSGSGTYTLPANCRYIKVQAIGAGGGGGGSGTSGQTAGGTGGNTTFSTYTASGGGGGATGTGSPGTGTGGTPTANSGSPAISILGAAGQSAVYATASSATNMGGSGGNGFFGGAGAAISSVVGTAGSTNSGGGGAGGAGNSAACFGGGGGASGSYLQQLIASPSGTYSYGVGAAGTAGGGGTSGTAGTAGGSGIIIVDEYYV